jgi:uncharacterized repeat protein (TIGR02543 family)
MKVSRGRLGLLSISVIASAMVAACPLPYNYEGKAAGGNLSPDPSTPRMTGAVTASCTEQGGSPTTVANEGSFVSEKTTTLTLSTSTSNSVIYYTDDGTEITSVSSAKRINGSSGDFTITRATTVQSLDIHAVAVGPNMLPSLPVHVTAVVSPYPVLTVTCDKASVTEDGGTTATFTIASSSAPSVDITINLQTGGDYSTSNQTGLSVGPNSPLTATLKAGATTVSPVSVAGVRDPSTASHTVILMIQPDNSATPAYTVGAPSSASVVLQDDGKFTLAYNANGGGGTVPAAANYAPGTPVTVQGGSGLSRAGYSFSGWNTQPGGNGTAYAANETLTMPSADVTLYATWAALPQAATPTFSPAGGTFASAQTVTISCATPGATIRYTTDGTQPSATAGTVYSGPITISSYAVVQAIAYAPSFTDSAVAATTYTILSSFAGPWTLTNQMGTVMGVFYMVLVGTDTYHFINDASYVWSGVYQLQGSTLVMITPDNPSYTGFVWTIDSQTHLTLSNTAYAGSTCAR